ncbi:YraN family protein [bacterium]|jgi:putative endonuclease|nr:YraN family protein [bacterium]
MDRRKALGNWGERVASSHMAGLGARLIDRNYTWKGGELDLIFERDEILVFVEVRTREEDAFMHPLETIDDRKCAKIKRTAFYYYEREWKKESLCQFDIITLIGNPDGYKLEHFERAFE